MSQSRAPRTRRRQRLDTAIKRRDPAGPYCLSEDPLHKLCAPILEVVTCVETPLASLSKVRAAQRQLAPLQAAVWPDSRARTVPPNLSELCQSTRPLRPVSALRRVVGERAVQLDPREARNRL